MENNGNTKGIAIDGLIQHKCGVPHRSERSMRKESEDVDKAFRAFFAKRGRQIPKISGCFLALTEEQEEALNLY